MGPVPIKVSNFQEQREVRELRESIGTGQDRLHSRDRDAHVTVSGWGNKCEQREMDGDSFWCGDRTVTMGCVRCIKQWAGLCSSRLGFESATDTFCLLVLVLTVSLIPGPSQPSFLHSLSLILSLIRHYSHSQTHPLIFTTRRLDSRTPPSPLTQPSSALNLPFLARFDTRAGRGDHCLNHLTFSPHTHPPTPGGSTHHTYTHTYHVQPALEQAKARAIQSREPKVCARESYPCHSTTQTHITQPTLLSTRTRIYDTWQQFHSDPPTQLWSKREEDRSGRTPRTAKKDVGLPFWLPRSLVPHHACHFYLSIHAS